MKGIIIKKIGTWLICCLVFNYVCYVSDLNSQKDDLFQRIDELVLDGKTSSKKMAKQSSATETIKNFTKPSVKKFEVKLDKKGNLLASWELLSEYDLTKKKPSVNLAQVIGKKISIKGFMVPLDYSAKQIKEFLLIPYMPSCAHVPPPSANTIINVSFDGNKKLRPSYYPIEINGVLKVSKPSGKSNPYLPEGIYSIVATSISETDE